MWVSPLSAVCLSFISWIYGKPYYTTRNSKDHMCRSTQMSNSLQCNQTYRLNADKIFLTPEADYLSHVKYETQRSEIPRFYNISQHFKVHKFSGSQNSWYFPWRQKQNHWVVPAYSHRSPNSCHKLSLLPSWDLAQQRQQYERALTQQKPRRADI